MSRLGITLRSAPRLAARVALAAAAITAVPADAGTRASAVAAVTATVNAPVTIHAARGSATTPSVSTLTPRAYSLRRTTVDDGGISPLRIVFVEFE